MHSNIVTVALVLNEKIFQLWCLHVSQTGYSIHISIYMFKNYVWELIIVIVLMFVLILQQQHNETSFYARWDSLPGALHISLSMSAQVPQLLQNHLLLALCYDNISIMPRIFLWLRKPKWKQYILIFCINVHQENVAIASVSSEATDSSAKPIYSLCAGRESGEWGKCEWMSWLLPRDMLWKSFIHPQQ